MLFQGILIEITIGFRLNAIKKIELTNQYLMKCDLRLFRDVLSDFLSLNDSLYIFQIKMA